MSDVQYTCLLPKVTFELGEDVAVILRASSVRGAEMVMDFNHRSLVLRLLSRDTSAESSSFPNRRTSARPEGLARYSLPSGPVKLAPRQSIERTFNLTKVFPELLLRPGRYSFTYSLEEHDPPITVGSGDAEVHSGPGAVRRLFQILETRDSDLEEPASGVLKQMLGQDFGFDVASDELAKRAAILAWKSWWETTGQDLAWDYASEGAIHGGAPHPKSEATRFRLGGVALP